MNGSMNGSTQVAERRPLRGQGRRTSSRTSEFRLILVVAICGSALACNSPAHRTQKLQAERQWNQLRSQVKARLAAGQFDQGRLDDAIATLREAIQLNPEQPAYHRLSAKCSLEKGTLAAAIASLDVAESLGDASADLSYLRGLIAERRARFDDARDHYSRAWSTDSNNVDHLIALAESLVAAGRPTDAAELLESHALDFDGDPKILLLRAHVYAATDQPELAAADFADVLERLQNPVQVREPYGLVLVRLRRFAEARALLQRAIPGLTATPGGASPPPSQSAVRALARCYMETGEPVLARRLLDDHLRLSPADARAWWLLAEANVILRDFDTAGRAAERGRRIRPDLPHWGLLNAYIAWQTDDKETATATLESVVADHPDNALAHSFLGSLRDATDVAPPTAQP